MDDRERLRLAVNTQRNRITWNKGHDAGISFGGGLGMIAAAGGAWLFESPLFHVLWFGIGWTLWGIARYYRAKRSGWIR